MAATAPGFTTQHGCKLLVHFELWQDMTGAITREKQLKGGSTWRDLYETLL